MIDRMSLPKKNTEEVIISLLNSVSAVIPTYIFALHILLFFTVLKVMVFVSTKILRYVKL